jgi:hypothetical protein
LLALLLGSCAPPSVRRQIHVAETDAAGGPSFDSAPPDDTGQDSGPLGSPDASPGDRGSIFDQAPDRLAQVPDAPPPDRAPPPDVAAPDQPALDAPRPRIRALMVVGNPAALGPDDQTVRALLVSKNIVVTLGDDDGNANQADGMDLVVISGSVVSATLGTKFQTIALPVLCLEAFSYGNMRMTGPVVDTDFSQTDAVEITIVLSTHPLAAGFPPGALTVTTAPTRLGWGIVAGTAERVASLVGMDNRSVIFSFEPGVQMSGLQAPARRVGVFPISPTPDLLNAAGLRLLGASIDWITRP